MTVSEIFITELRKELHKGLSRELSKERRSSRQVNQKPLNQVPHYEDDWLEQLEKSSVPGFIRDASRLPHYVR